MKPTMLKIAFSNRILILAIVGLSSAAVFAQTSALNYQGRLTEAGNPANGAFQMQFKLFDSLGGAGQVGSTITDVPVTVSQGVFSVKLDFGSSAFSSGANRWLEIAVRHNSGESYTTLSPREQIASSPYAVRTLSAAIADNALQLGGIAASEYVTTTNGGSSFIRNGTTLQTGSFNISGNGLVGGNLGIGVPTPVSRVDIAGQDGLRITGFQPFLTLRDANAGNARSIMAAGNGDFAFYPNSFIGGVPAVIMKNGTGNVGIGTVNPAAKLQIDGGSNFGFRADSQMNAIIGYSSGSGFAAIHGENTTGSGSGVYGKNTTGYAMFAEGNTGQSRDKGGWVKAMVFVNGSGGIVSCYNGMTGSSTPTCGISATRLETGLVEITFPFQVDDRFFSVTIRGSTLDTVVAELQSVNGNHALVETFESISGERQDRNFYLIVF